MEIFPKNIEEAMKIIYDILNQDDSRYNNTWNEQDLSLFLINKAIVLEEREIPNLKEPEKDELDHIYGVQKEEKYIAKILLKKKGFQDNEIFFERRFLVYRPDIFVKKEDNLVLVECCSCKIRKIMDYLTKSNEVWVLTKGDPPWRDSLFNERMKFFVFKKGQNWDKFIKIKKKELKKQLEKVKSPLDTL